MAPPTATPTTDLRPPDPPEDRSLERWIERWRQCHDGRMTAQKRLVLAALLDLDGHPTVDEVFDRARASMPELSRTTVFRILQSLVECGLVQPVSHPGPVARYELNDHPHHHLICTGCRRIFDLESDALDGLPEIPRPSDARGFEIRDVSIHFRGLCAGCREPARSSSHPRETT